MFCKEGVGKGKGKAEATGKRRDVKDHSGEVRMVTWKESAKRFNDRRGRERATL